MPPDAELFQRYADLLEGEAADLAPLAGQLDSLYGANEPPAHLELAIERAVRAHAAKQPSTPRGLHTRRWWSPGNAPTGGQTSMKRRQMQTLAACAAAFVVVALMAALLHGFAGGPAGPGSGQKLDDAQKQQLFNRLGGTYAVVQASCPTDKPGCDVGTALQETISVLTSRLAATFDVASMLVRQNGPDSVLIELPGVKNTKQQKLLLPLLSRGAVSFLDTGARQLFINESVLVCTTSCRQGQYKAVLTGADIDPSSVSAGLDPNTGQPVVTFAFKGDARAHFADYTRTHIGQFFTVALDNRVIESAVIQSAIDGAGQIVGFATPDNARAFALYLKRGALPVQLAIVDLRVVAPGTPPASGAPCGQGTPLPTPTPWPNHQPTPTATAWSASQPTPTASPTASNSVQPTATAFSGSESCPSPTPMPGNTPTPGPTPIGTPTPPPTPTMTPFP